MKFCRFKHKENFYLWRLTPLCILALMVLEIYSVCMLFHINSYHKMFEDNKSIIYENQVLLPELTFPLSFNGNLSELVDDSGVMYIVPYGSYELVKKDATYKVSIRGYVFDAEIVYACVDKSYVLTDGDSVWLFIRPSYWDISIGRGIFGRVPDVFCKYLMLPWCCIFLPDLIYKFDKNTKSKGVVAVMYILTVVGMYLSLLQTYQSILLLYK